MTIMTIVSMRERIGATPGKLALVGVLAVVLVMVIVVQLRSSSSTSKMKTAPVSELPGRKTTTDEAAVATSAPQSQEKNSEEKPPRNWPELTMNAITAFDPLDAPTWYLTAANFEETSDQTGPTLTSAEDQAHAVALEALKQAGTAIVLIANGERIAMIGERQVRIGDSIEGYEVSDITDQGVVLTKPGPR